MRRAFPGMIFLVSAAGQWSGRVEQYQGSVRLLIGIRQEDLRIAGASERRLLTFVMRYARVLFTGFPMLHRFCV